MPTFPDWNVSVTFHHEDPLEVIAAAVEKDPNVVGVQENETSGTLSVVITASTLEDAAEYGAALLPADASVVAATQKLCNAQ